MRSTPFVKKLSPQQLQSIRTAQTAGFMIISQQGPLGFTIFEIPAESAEMSAEQLAAVLQKPKKLHKTQLGAPHMCTCDLGSKSHYCPHIAFLILRKFRIPQDDQLACQTSWTDMELDRILAGITTSRPLKRSSVSAAKDGQGAEPTPQYHERIEIAAETYCAVCLEGLMGEDPATLPFCAACGNSVHERCLYMLLAAARHNSQQAKCIYCREGWQDGRKLIYKNGKAGKRREPIAVSDRNACTVCKRALAKGQFVERQFSKDRVCFHCLIELEKGSYSVNGRAILLKAAPQASLKTDRYHINRYFENRDITQRDYDLLLRLDDPRADISNVAKRLPTYLALKTFHRNATGELFECQLCQCRKINPYNLTERLDVNELQLNRALLLSQLREHELRVAPETLAEYEADNTQFFLPCGQHVVHALCALVCACDRPVLRSGEEYYQTKLLSDTCEVCHIVYLREWLRESRLAQPSAPTLPRAPQGLKPAIKPQRPSRPQPFEANDLANNIIVQPCMPKLRR